MSIQKQGLDYFPLDVNMKRDRKVAVLFARHGHAGISVYIDLLSMIYNNGYYILFDSIEQEIIASDNKIELEFFKSIIETCFERGLFEKSLYMGKNILTSSSIQKRFFDAVKRRIEVKVNPQYLAKDLSVVNLKKKYKNLVFEGIDYQHGDNVYVEQDAIDKIELDNSGNTDSSGIDLVVINNNVDIKGDNVDSLPQRREEKRREEERREDDDVSEKNHSDTAAPLDPLEEDLTKFRKSKKLENKLLDRANNLLEYFSLKEHLVGFKKGSQASKYQIKVTVSTKGNAFSLRNILLEPDGVSRLKEAIDRYDDYMSIVKGVPKSERKFYFKNTFAKFREKAEEFFMDKEQYELKKQETIDRINDRRGDEFDASKEVDYDFEPYVDAGDGDIDSNDESEPYVDAGDGDIDSNDESEPYVDAVDDSDSYIETNGGNNELLSSNTI